MTSWLKGWARKEGNPLTLFHLAGIDATQLVVHGNRGTASTLVDMEYFYTISLDTFEGTEIIEFYEPHPEYNTLCPKTGGQCEAYYKALLAPVGEVIADGHGFKKHLKPCQLLPYEPPPDL
jgi:hypothetical protein